MKKFGKVMIAAAVCALWGSITAFAGEWKSDANGRWYVKDDGNYVVSDWLTDNGKCIILTQMAIWFLTLGLGIIM